MKMVGIRSLRSFPHPSAKKAIMADVPLCTDDHSFAVMVRGYFFTSLPGNVPTFFFSRHFFAEKIALFSLVSHLLGSFSQRYFGCIFQFRVRGPVVRSPSHGVLFSWVFFLCVPHPFGRAVRSDLLLTTLYVSRDFKCLPTRLSWNTSPPLGHSPDSSHGFPVRQIWFFFFRLSSYGFTISPFLYQFGFYQPDVFFSNRFSPSL